VCVCVCAGVHARGICLHLYVCTYCLTCLYEIVTSLYEIVTCLYEIVTCLYAIVTCLYKIMLTWRVIWTFHTLNKI